MAAVQGEGSQKRMGARQLRGGAPNTTIPQVGRRAQEMRRGPAREGEKLELGLSNVDYTCELIVPIHHIQGC